MIVGLVHWPMGLSYIKWRSDTHAYILYIIYRAYAAIVLKYCLCGITVHNACAIKHCMIVATCAEENCIYMQEFVGIIYLIVHCTCMRGLQGEAIHKYIYIYIYIIHIYMIEAP